MDELLNELARSYQIHTVFKLVNMDELLNELPRSYQIHTVLKL